MACCARAAPLLLLHVNILLVLYAGALLTAGARLAWDPSLYMALRALLPAELRGARAGAPLLGAALLLLAHLGGAALLARGPALRRALLLGYALCTLCVWASELALLGWAAWRAAPLVRDPTLLTSVAADLRAVLRLLARYHPLPDTLHQLFDEAWADLPRNGYCAASAGAVLLLLQPAAAVAALLTRAAVPVRKRRKEDPLISDDSVSSTDSRSSEQRKLKTVYRNGKLALV